MTDSNIYFEDPIRPLGKTTKRIKWIQAVAQSYDFEIGELCINICSDETLLEINQRELDHDFYTDIITFDHSIGKQISGDLWISIDRVEENAQELGEDPNDELDRVIIHGVLHLIGFGDKTAEEAKQMREEEDKCLNLRPFSH